MATATGPLAERAERVFRELGYTVRTEGRGLRAERKWRSVRVTPVERASDLPAPEEYHCFVTWAEEAARVRDRLSGRAGDCEWAVLGVSEDGGYEVYRAGEAA